MGCLKTTVRATYSGFQVILQPSWIRFTNMALLMLGEAEED